MHTVRYGDLVNINGNKVLWNISRKVEGSRLFLGSKEMLQNNSSMFYVRYIFTMEVKVICEAVCGAFFGAVYRDHKPSRTLYATRYTVESSGTVVL